MPFAAAVSSHPVTAHATGEVVGQVIDEIGAHPDLAMLVVSPSHLGALEDAAAAVRSLLAPTVLLGWVAAEVDGDVGWGYPELPWAPVPPSAPAPPSALAPLGDGVGLWAAHTGPAVPVRLEDLASPGWARVGPESFDRRSLIVIGAAGVAPGMIGAAGVASGVALPRDLTVAGAVSDVAGAPVILDGAVHATGAVGVVLGPGVDLTVVVEQGRRPVGAPAMVTRTEGSLLVALDDRPAMSVLTDIARDQVPAADIALINRSVHLEVTCPAAGTGTAAGAGTVPGSVHAVRGRDAATGALVTDPEVQPGDVVQFCVLDPVEAGVRARRLVDGAEGGALAWRTRRSDTGPGLHEHDGDGGRALRRQPRPPRSLLACRAASLLGMSEGGGPSAAPGTIGIGLFREPRVALG